ncbi:low molecular weight protein-tyrosine-phosphatase [Kangiella sp. TOML190]|uniref:low molecular weight protein-tyrosine-phosphatase n=1 Tax=Kangiella sp. TOML190 TaxID=2931351 RepID=UPI0020419AB9|nr:low molecular weight protein-tyrosine-phosphatase [Kangiella sp. TOML190]
MYSILFVCLGNICRSPTAEGVFRAKAEQAGIANKLFIDSAGTSAYHLGEPPDERSQQHAAVFGYDLSAIRSRKVAPQDFDTFDLIIAMDQSNLDNLKLYKSNGYSDKLKLFLADFAPQLGISQVPDPYYGGTKGFTEVVKLIEVASDGLIDYITPKLG